MGEAAFDVSIEVDRGEGFGLFADLGRRTTGVNLFPPAQESLNGNLAANRVSFDSGPIEGDLPAESRLRIMWRPATDTATQNWVFGLDNVSLTLFGDQALTQLVAGDADQDLDFDQLDLVKVQIANKYLTGQAASWGDGDWNGAPGGSPGNPPAGDGLFNQFDIIAAQQGAAYLTGRYASIQTGGRQGDGQTSVIYDAGTGEVSVDAPAEVELTSINIDSASGIFKGTAAQSLGGSFDNDADDNIFKATFGGSFGSVSFGNVAQSGLSEQFVLGDLTVIGSLAGGGDLGNVDLVYVPEPSTTLLLLLGSGGLLASVRLHENRIRPKTKARTRKSASRNAPPCQEPGHRGDFDFRANHPIGRLRRSNLPTVLGDWQFRVPFGVRTEPSVNHSAVFSVRLEKPGSGQQPESAVAGGLTSVPPICRVEAQQA